MKNILKFLAVLFLLLISNKIIALNKAVIKNDTTIRIESEEDIYYEKYKAIGGSFFVGYGNLNGNISQFISNPLFIGMNIDILRQKFVFQIDDYIGFGNTKMTLNLSNNEYWNKNKFTLHGILGGNIGYSLIDSESIKIVPLVGVGVGILTTNLINTNDYEPLLPYYKLGCYIDLKSLKLFRNNISFNYNNSYTCARLSFGVNSSIGKPKYDTFFKGSMIYITIGMGGLNFQ
jgi:hypothetical protein